MKKLLSQSIKTLFLALLFGAVTVFAQWAPPSGTPTSMNAPTPINTSAENQNKAGKLMIPGIQTGGLYVGPTGFTGIPTGSNVHVEGGVSIGNAVTIPASGNLSVKKSIGAGTVNMASSPAGSIGASGLIAAGGDIFTALGNIYSGAGAYIGSYLPNGTTGGVAAERFCLPGTNGSGCITTWPSSGSTLPSGAVGDTFRNSAAGVNWVAAPNFKNDGTSLTLANPGTLTLSALGSAVNPVLCHDATGKVIACVVSNGGGTLMPPGTQDQTLRHNGTNWVASSKLAVSDNGGNSQVSVNTNLPLKVKIPQNFDNDREVLYLDNGSSMGSATRVTIKNRYLHLWSDYLAGYAEVRVGKLFAANLTPNSYVCTGSLVGWIEPCAGPSGSQLPNGNYGETLHYVGGNWVSSNVLTNDTRKITVASSVHPYDEYKFTVNKGGLLVDLSSVNTNNWMGKNALTLKVNTSVNSMATILTNAPTFQFWNSTAGAPAHIEAGNIHAAGNINADSYIHSDGSISADGNIDAFGHIASAGGYIFANVTATTMTQVPGDVRAQHSLISDNLANNNFNPVCADSVGKLALCSVSSGTNVESFTTPGTSTWTVPAGVNSIRVQVFGAGGGGAGGSTGCTGNWCAGGGGGGGGYIDATVTVTPGQDYSVVVGNNGNGGAGGPGNGNASSPGTIGGQSKFGTNIIANGGNGAPSNATSPYNEPGTGGSASGPGIVAPGFIGGEGDQQSPHDGGAGGFSGGGSGYSYGKGGKGGDGFSTAQAGSNGVDGAVIITY